MLDGGELPGTPSTVVDLGSYEEAGEWTVLREGAVPRERLADLLRLMHVVGDIRAQLYR